MAGLRSPPRGWESGHRVRLDMGAMLDVAGRLEAFGSRVIALIKQRVERFQDERFVVFLCRGLHGYCHE
jgi:hypothetical protein